MKRILIKNAFIVNEGTTCIGSVVIENEVIKEILADGDEPAEPCNETIDATGCYLLPGAIDAHVHFRDPGLTHKADIASESRAAAAGGVTSVMDMPNTNPQTTTVEALNAKFDLFAEKSVVNYSCYFGATNNNYSVLPTLDKHRVCGVKLFMGSSTGNMLVDRREALQNIFCNTDMVIATHCEDQAVIRQNTDAYCREKNNTEDLPIAYHPLIRSEEACYQSTRQAVELAQAANARLHVLHISTGKELELFEQLPLTEKRITAEACVSHLMFCDEDYKTAGTRIKCNPAIKSAEDREALRQAVGTGRIDTIATDHAPHLLSEKEGGALKAVSGMPSIQFSLVNMLELVHQGVLCIETVVERMCHAPATIYEINRRGYLRPGYQADLALVRPHPGWEVTAGCVLSKCGWSPFEGNTYHWNVEKTFVNGHLLYSDGQIDDNYRGQELRFR